MATGQISQLDITTVSSALTANLRLSQFDFEVVFNIPSDAVEISQMDFTTVTQQDAMPVQISQFDFDVVYRGRTDDPRVRAWRFPLDGHEFYVLRLAGMETLVCDVSMNPPQWFVWGSGQAGLWRAYTGDVWNAGRKLAGAYANIVVGDDGNGALYFLDPGGEWDDDALVGSELPRRFERVVTAQYLVPAGYASQPCYGLQVFGSAGQIVETGLVASLQMSDDRGISFYDVDSRSTPVGEYDVRLNWGSLGGMKVPGRLFKIIDDGALLRVDGLDMAE